MAGGNGACRPAARPSAAARSDFLSPMSTAASPAPPHRPGSLRELPAMPGAPQLPPQRMPATHSAGPFGFGPVRLLLAGSLCSLPCLAALACRRSACLPPTVPVRLLLARSVCSWLGPLHLHLHLLTHIFTLHQKTALCTTSASGSSTSSKLAAAPASSSPAAAAAAAVAALILVSCCKLLLQRLAGGNHLVAPLVLALLPQLQQPLAAGRSGARGEWALSTN